jgi:hypothetical protein
VSETQRSLVRKLADVMAEVSHVPKNGNNAAQGYKYATEADVLASIRKGLASRHVIITHRVDSTTFRQIDGRSGALFIATVHVTFTAHDGDSGESMEVARTVGEGMDSGDKNVYKAVTGATKYAALKLFFIPTGDDPEAGEEPGEPAPQAGGAQPKPQAPRLVTTPARVGGGPTVFPNYGKAKGEPIGGAATADLEFYANGCRRSLADASKARFHNQEQALLNAIDAEIRRQRSTQAEGPPPPGDDDAPF